MNDDPLRDRIARTDPVLDGADISPMSSDSSQHLLEDIMNTPFDNTNSTTNSIPSAGRSPRRWQWALGAAAVAALAVGGAALGGVFDSGDGSGEIAGTSTDSAPPTAPGKLTVLELSTGDTDPAMMSCMALDPAMIAMSPLAFKGTATMVEGDLVTLLVDKWYVGGDAGQVTLTAPTGMEALIGGLAFEPHKQYTVAAYDGVVSYCGLTGEATPELEGLYDTAFPG